MNELNRTETTAAVKSAKVVAAAAVAAAKGKVSVCLGKVNREKLLVEIFLAQLA